MTIESTRVSLFSAHVLWWYWQFVFDARMMSLRYFIFTSSAGEIPKGPLRQKYEKILEEKVQSSECFEHGQLLHVWGVLQVYQGIRCIKVYHCSEEWLLISWFSQSSLNFYRGFVYYNFRNCQKLFIYYLIRTQRFMLCSQHTCLLRVNQRVIINPILSFASSWEAVKNINSLQSILLMSIAIPYYKFFMSLLLQSRMYISTDIVIHIPRVLDVTYHLIHSSEST